MRMCSAEESAAYPVMENQLCAVGSGGSSIYLGDSGGPISLKSGDQHVKVGDASFVPSCIPATGYTVRTTERFWRMKPSFLGADHGGVWETLLLQSLAGGRDAGGDSV